LGEESAVGLLAANNTTPDTAFRITRRGVEEKFAVPAGPRPSVYAEGCFVVEKMDRDILAAANDGKIYFQDEGSQIVGQAVNLTTGERFLDVCAAPGSKTTQVAATAAAGSTLVVAGDLHFGRVAHLRENCVRQRIANINLLQYDAEQPLPFGNGIFDAVLVDAPCTGTGTIRHNPEIRYLLEPGDPAGLARKQQAILQNAAGTVRTGGRLVYSTCSLEPEENEAVAERFRASNPQFELRRPGVPPKFLTHDGFARTSPGRDGLDGFFVAAFERVGE
jgi:16S rRNA (cytosine967-C5)-methyltransferase